MVQEEIDKLPPCCIVSQWTKNTKEVDDQLNGNKEDSDKLASLQFRSLLQECRLVATLHQGQGIAFYLREKICSIAKDLEVE